MKKLGNETKTLLGLILSLAWPTMVEQALETMVQYADSAMVGHISAHASACVGLTTSVTWLVNAPMYALGVGVLACIARSIGAKEYEMAKRYAVQTILLAIAAGVILGGITLGISRFLPAWMGAEESLRHDGGLYFAIICMPMLFRAATILFASAMNATGDMKRPMVIHLVMNGTNLVLNYLLIYPSRTVSLLNVNIPMPGAGLGVIGAAIATAIAYVVGGTCMTVCLFRSRTISPKGRKLRPDREAMLPCIRIGIPVMLQRVASCLGQVVFGAMVTSLGTVPLATHSLANTAEQAFYIPGYGMQAAASTLAGQALGEKNERKLNKVSLMIILLAAGIMTVTGSLLFAFPGQMMRLFTEDAEVIAGGITVLRIVAVSEPAFGAHIILEGTFNGVGDTKAPFAITLVCMWGIRILFTFICLNLFGLGLPAVWCCMVADNVSRCLLLLIRYIRGSWKKKLVFD